MGWAAQFFDPVATGVTYTNTLVVRNASLRGGASAGFAQADSAATLPNAPVAVRWIPGSHVAAGSLETPFIKDDMEGMLTLRPGTTINTFSLTNAVTVAIALYWLEIPILT